jgi:D-alanyl-lipoteichoic acid acyltransferase DltB (MBOAT superfamily)
MYIDWRRVVLGIVFGVLIAIVAFCLTALIFASINRISFVEQLKEWFGIAKEVAENNEETAKLFGILR